MHALHELVVYSAHIDGYFLRLVSAVGDQTNLLHAMFRIECRLAQPGCEETLKRTMMHCNLCRTSHPTAARGEARTDGTFK